MFEFVHVSTLLLTFESKLQNLCLVLIALLGQPDTLLIIAHLTYLDYLPKLAHESFELCRLSIWWKVFHLDCVVTRKLVLASEVEYCTATAILPVQQKGKERQTIQHVGDHYTQLVLHTPLLKLRLRQVRCLHWLIGYAKLHQHCFGSTSSSTLQALSQYIEYQGWQ